MILHDRCSTLYDLASLFRGRHSTLDRWSGKIEERIGTRPSALHSTFHSWRKSRRIASFLLLSTSKTGEASQNCFVLRLSNSKTEEVSQNCFVFDAVSYNYNCHYITLLLQLQNTTYNILQHTTTYYKILQDTTTYCTTLHYTTRLGTTRHDTTLH